MALCYQCFHEVDTTAPCPDCGFDPREQAKKYPMALPLGSILNGRYIVGRALGQGGFGITYLAMDDAAGQRVAVKEYFPSEFAWRAGGSLQVQVHSSVQEENFAFGKTQFLEEARTMAAVKGDDHIVRVYSYFEENGTAYFSMEFVDGLPLNKYMAARGGCLTVEEADSLLLPLMQALAEVHSRGIVHRDIAPDNIIITHDDVAKLIDFGAARYSTGEVSKSLDIILKHGFAPREQYTRRGRQGPWTDVYALAATYYYAITGKVPPDAIDRTEEDTLQLPHTLGVEITPAREAALSKGLAVLAAERWQNMTEFRLAMQEADPAAEAEQPAREKEAREEAERRAKAQAERERRRAEQAAAAEHERLQQETVEAGRAAEAGREPAQPAEQQAPPAKKRSPLPLILAAALVLAAAVFGITRLTGHDTPSALPSPEAAEAGASGVAGIYTPGTYSAVAEGRASDITVTMTFDAFSITDVKVDVSGEAATIGGSIGGQMEQAILAAQGADVDAVSGATISSDAVRAAAADCIAMASGGEAAFTAAAEDVPTAAPEPTTVTQIAWSLDEDDGTLTIGGGWDMPDYTEGDAAPWLADRHMILSVVIEDGVTRIGDGAFCVCPFLSRVTIPDSVTSIGDQAFYGCGSLLSITLPDSVTSIGLYAFSSSLISITIPDGVTAISSNTFDGCFLLKSVTIPASVTGIGKDAFSKCPHLADVYYSGTEAQWADVVIAIGNEALTGATIHFGA